MTTACCYHALGRSRALVLLHARMLTYECLVVARIFSRGAVSLSDVIVPDLHTNQDAPMQDSFILDLSYTYSSCRTVCQDVASTVSDSEICPHVLCCRDMLTPCHYPSSAGLLTLYDFIVTNFQSNEQADHDNDTLKKIVYFDSLVTLDARSICGKGGKVLTD